MADLVMLVPSRGRPQAAAELAEAFYATSVGAARLVLVIDDDDPEHERYFAALRKIKSPGRTTNIVSVQNNAGTMVGALNEAAVAFADSGDWFGIGFLGDDHRPRTQGWDKAYLDALNELGIGIVYGDDLFQRERLPTQCAMTADIVRELGYMAPRVLRHMYVDNAWLDLGRAANCIRYLPEVTIEHVHPIAGKAKWDEGYHRVNDPSVFRADFRAWMWWRQARLDAVAEQIRALRERPHE